MPDPSQPNVFAIEFLEQAFEHEPPPITEPEAAWAGPWKVEPQGGNFFVVRESGVEPAVVTDRRETALLLAAVLPVAGREPWYWIERQQTGKQVALKTARGKGVVTVGRLRSEHHGRGSTGGLSVTGGILTAADAQEDLQGGFAGLGKSQLAVLAKNVESAAATTPVGNNKGLPAGGVDPQAESSKLGIPEVTGTGALIDRLVDRPLVEPDLHRACLLSPGQGRLTWRLLGL